jgi:hypothetical protein
MLSYPLATVSRETRETACVTLALPQSFGFGGVMGGIWPLTMPWAVVLRL